MQKELIKESDAWDVLWSTLCSLEVSKATEHQKELFCQMREALVMLTDTKTGKPILVEINAALLRLVNLNGQR